MLLYCTCPVLIKKRIEKISLRPRTHWPLFVEPHVVAFCGVPEHTSHKTRRFVGHKSATCGRLVADKIYEVSCITDFYAWVRSDLWPTKRATKRQCAR